MSSDVKTVVTQIKVSRVKELICDSTWIVENLNLDLPFKEGQYITSPVFEIDTKSYKLQLYPGGLSQTPVNVPNSMVLYFPIHNLKNYGCDVYLVHENRNKVLQFLSIFTITGTYFHVERSKITSDFLPNGHLTIKWKLHYYIGEKLVESLPKESIENIANKRRLAELDDYEKLLKDNRFGDLKIVVDEKTFFVYKGILAARSRYFADMFKFNMKEVEEGVIHITDISANIMQEILRFIYTGKIDIDMTMATDLLIAANMYDLAGLSAICGEAILRA